MIFKLIYRLFFVFLPIIIYTIIFYLFLKSPSEGKQYIEIESYIYMLFYSLIIFIIVYFIHKLMGKKTILITVITGFCVLLQGLSTNLNTEAAIGFYWISIPFFTTVSIHSIGFFIYDMLIGKKAKDDKDNNKD